MATSLVSSRSTTANLFSPKKCSLLISFNECTAISASPLTNALKISCVKKSLPSAVCKGIFCNSSPLLLRAITSTRISGKAASILFFTISICKSDSLELLPISFIVCMQNLFKAVSQVIDMFG